MVQLQLTVFIIVFVTIYKAIEGEFNIKDLLKNNERRRLNLLSCLRDQQNWVTISDLAKQIKSSERAIVND